MDRFGLTSEHMREITHSTRSRIEKLLNREVELNETEISHLCEVFNIKTKVFKNPYPLPLLTMKKEIDIEKYKNILNAYVEILKEYYPEPWEVYVLAKIPYRNAFQSFIEMFSSKNIESLEQKTGPFTPNYLAINGERYLLVNIKNSTLEVSEIGEAAEAQRFIYKKFKYVRANRVQLKKYTPEVEMYFKNF